jgi:hypothetical protein
VLFWSVSPIGVLLSLTTLYGTASIFLYRRLSALQQNWKSFPATLDQLRKDRECFEKILA